MADAAICRLPGRNRRNGAAPVFMRGILIFFTLVAALIAVPARATFDSAVTALGFGESDEKVAAITELVGSGDVRTSRVLEALAAGQLQTADKRVLIVQGDTATDAISAEKLASLPESRDDVVLNNRLRGAVQAALAALRLTSPDSATRLAAAKELAVSPDDAMLPLISKALQTERDPATRALLEQTRAALEITSGNRDTRIAAIRALGQSSNPNSRTLLVAVLDSEKDLDLQIEAQKSLDAVEGRLAWGQRAGLLFAGLSLGSILLLAALGLAITYGLMGVINMAHGELMMIGAYATYFVQNLFRTYLPGAFDWYLACAVPMSFLAAGLVGVALERTVIRWLYGRPLETLLATWGISLMLMQGVRSLFGAQNVQVENPAFMSGGIEILSDIVLPWNRVVIIAFALGVLVVMWLLLARTRLGLYVRGVTQNRAMASALGVPTGRVDMWAFGLGCGIAGLAGCALSQIGNVGPDLGQAYIVDSFMVVVFGGVGQLAGTVYAALILGMSNKLLETWSGAVIAKIVVLVFIIFFIQRRPQGMFALKGRAVEA
jgi:urea transport system permease protein